MSIVTNRISGSAVWGMTTDHTVMMLRDPDLALELGNIDLELPAGHNVDLELPAGSNIDIEVVVE